MLTVNALGTTKALVFEAHRINIKDSTTTAMLALSVPVLLDSLGEKVPHSAH